MEYLKSYSKEFSKIKPVTDHLKFSRKYDVRNLLGDINESGSYDIPKYKIKQIMFDKDIVSIEEYFEPEPLYKPISFVPFYFSQGSNPSLEALARSAYNPSDTPVPSNAGNQIETSTFEIGLTQDFLNCSGLNSSTNLWDPNLNFNPNDGTHIHSLETFKCLTHAAPGAIFNHRDALNYAPIASRDWISDNDIRTSSLSYNRYYSSPTDEEPRVMDNFAYIWPFTVFVNPTANSGWTLEAAWKPYNSLNVGNVQHYLYYTFFINNCTGVSTSSGCTQTRNPIQRYGGNCLRPADSNYNYCSSDRELPHIVVPGDTPLRSFHNPCFANPMYDNCISPYPIYCGTSYSAPIGNGIAAAVMAADGRVQFWPEKVRAAILVTAENVDGGDWSTGDDGRDGVGVINGASAVAFAQSYTAVDPGNSPVQKGMGVGEIRSSTWNTALQYKISVPNPIPSGKYLRIVLLWDSNPSLTAAVNAVSDLDLVAYSGVTTRSSASYNNNIEIAHFYPTEVQAGGTVTVDISKYANRIPNSGIATTDYFFYAIAWDWVDTHAP